jgi:hypothetical protein
MAKKAMDPLKAKQKKQKILAACLGVAFIGVMAFQVPRLMKKDPPTPSVNGLTSTTGVTGTPTLAAPTLGGSAAPTTTPTTSSGALASTNLPVQDGVLASFGLFSSKDPFSQQIATGAAAEPSVGGGGSGGSAPSVPSGLPTTSGKPPAPGSAVISVNGTLYDVPVGTDFPQASPTDPTIVPLFHLISLTSSTAKISIVGGSYSSGAPSVVLKVNKPVTLMNTADGTRYQIVLKAPGTGVPSQGGGAASPASPETSTPASTSPTSTTVPLPSP